MCNLALLSIISIEHILLIWEPMKALIRVSHNVELSFPWFYICSGLQEKQVLLALKTWAISVICPVSLVMLYYNYFDTLYLFEKFIYLVFYSIVQSNSAIWFNTYEWIINVELLEWWLGWLWSNLCSTWNRIRTKNLKKSSMDTNFPDHFCHFAWFFFW